MNEIVPLSVHHEYNTFPEVITYDDKNPVVHSPYATSDLFFYQTKESLADVDTFRNFLKNYFCEYILKVY